MLSGPKTGANAHDEDAKALATGVAQLNERTSGGESIHRPIVKLAAGSRAGGSKWRSVRFRLTAAYGGLSFLSGSALLTITYLLVDGLPLSPSRIVSIPPGSGNIPVAVAEARAIVLHDLLLRSGFALAVMALISVWVGWFIAGRVLRPLRAITAMTRQISQKNLNERLALSGPDDELKELGDTIDELLGRLERAFEDQQVFVANASHELRTPLAMIRTSLDVAEAKPVPMSQDASVIAAKVRQSLDQADRLVESFLVLARAELDLTTNTVLVSLPELASRALESQVAALGERDIVVRTNLNPADVSGSEILLSRMVANVVDNAVRYNVTPGYIEITTTVSDSTAQILVQSGGQVLDPSRIEQLTQPFRRLGTDRTGSDGGVGLGLSIVLAIAKAHDGTLGLRARVDGGLCVLIELPSIEVSSGKVRSP